MGAETAVISRNITFLMCPRSFVFVQRVVPIQQEMRRRASSTRMFYANRSTVRRIDGIWRGLEKAGLRPERLQLEWCSAAEGPRWQTIMHETEKKRQSVTVEELEFTRNALVKARVPRPRNPKPADEEQEVEFACMRCGHHWGSIFSANRERTCSECRSNSVRWLWQTNK